jgi:NAD(P)-dependent dehydrogenase (short-subunit alcohol dehydrogenase family)
VGFKLALEGNVAVVTGASRGLGREFAVDLARCGASIAVTARSAGDLAETARLVEAQGVQCVQVVGEVTDPAVAVACVRSATVQLGAVDLLVNNAGIFDGRLFWEANLDEWWSVFEVDVRAPATWIAAVLPGMKERGRGRIINVSSPGGFIPLPYYSAYCSSKAALTQLTACLAIELRRDGIAVLAIGPKAHTDMGKATYENEAIHPALRGAFRVSFASDPDGIMKASLDVFRVVATGGADHLSGMYFGDRGATFDTPEDVARQTPDPRIESLAAMLRT